MPNNDKTTPHTPRIDRIDGYDSRGPLLTLFTRQTRKKEQPHVSPPPCNATISLTSHTLPPLIPRPATATHSQSPTNPKSTCIPKGQSVDLSIYR